MDIFDWGWFEVKCGASSRWLPLYCSMRNSDQTTIEKTHATLLTLRPQKWQKSPISFCLAGEFLFRDSMDMRTICLFLYLLIWHKQSTVTVKSLYNILPQWFVLVLGSPKNFKFCQPQPGPKSVLAPVQNLILKPGWKSCPGSGSFHSRTISRTAFSRTDSLHQLKL